MMNKEPALVKFFTDNREILKPFEKAISFKLSMRHEGPKPTVESFRNRAERFCTIVPLLGPEFTKSVQKYVSSSESLSPVDRLLVHDIFMEAVILTYNQVQTDVACKTAVVSGSRE